MVQFVFTPWRDRAELLRVREQLYPAFATTTSSPTTANTTTPTPWWSSAEELQAVEKALARVFMWVHRGGCPHVVESTALLMSAIVFDARGGHDAVAVAAVTAGYLVGFTRFVTGLLDGHQDKARKLSMYGVAKTIGLPASFVELRHQGTHEPMPSLAQLRPAARRALVWIWEYYWRNLPGEEDCLPGEDGPPAVGGDGRAAGEAGGVEQDKGKGRKARKEALKERMCRAALLGYLQRPGGEVGDDTAREGLMRQLRQWDDVLVVGILADIGGSARDGAMLLRSVKLSRAILDSSTETEAPRPEEEMDERALRDELARAKAEAERRNSGSLESRLTGKRKKKNDEEGDEAIKRGGWFRWQGPWVPRPIGVL